MSWDHGHGTRAERLKCLGGPGAADLVFLRVRGLDAPGPMERSGRGDTSRPNRPKGLPEQNPMSGSGCHVPARPEGEQAVEGVENPEDGQWRVRQARVERLPPVDVAEGALNPRRGDPVLPDRGGHRSPNLERAAKPAEAAGRSSDRSAMLADGTPRGRGNGAEGVAKPMTPLRRPERFERYANPVRVVRGAATRRGTVATAPKPLEGRDRKSVV